MQYKIPLWTDVPWNCQCRVLVSTTLLETKGWCHILLNEMVQGLYLCSTLDCPKSSTLLTCELSMDTSLFLRLAFSCSVWSFCCWQTFRWFTKAMFCWVRSIFFCSELFKSSSNSWTRDRSSPQSVAFFIFSLSSSSASLGRKLSSYWAKVKEIVQQINC